VVGLVIWDFREGGGYSTRPTATRAGRDDQALRRVKPESRGPDDPIEKSCKVSGVTYRRMGPTAGGAMSEANETELGLIDGLNRHFAALAGWCFDQRWLVLCFCAALAVGSGWLAAGVEQDASYESYFDEGDTTFRAYEAYREDFGSDEVSYIGYEIPGSEYGPWSVEAMESLVTLTKALEDEVPFVYSVTTLANAEFTVGTEGGISISRIRNDWPLSQEELLRLRDAYLKKPFMVGGIIDEDADFGAIIIKMDRSSPDPPEELVWDPEKGMALENLYPQVTDAAIDEILGRPEYSDFAFFHSGDVPLNAYYNRILLTEPVTLLLASLGVISLILLVSFRSFVSVLTPAIVLILTMLMTVALMALLGFKIDLSFMSTPTILMAIGVAHSVHILSEFGSRFRESGDRRESLVQTIALVGVPCLLTSVTTAIGFASMSFVPIKSISNGAIYKSFGVFAAFVLSMTLLMALLSFDWSWPWRALRHRIGSIDRAETHSQMPSSPTSQPRENGRLVARILNWVIEFNIERRNLLIGGFTILLVVFGVGMTRVSIDSNWLDDFWDDVPVSRNTVRVDEEMGGTTNVIYLFDSGADDAIKEPAVLREIDRLAALAREDTWLVRKTYSIADIVKDLNQTFHSDDPAYYRIPDTRAEVSQYLLLYEISGGLDAEEFVSSDYRRANLELRLRLAPTTETEKLIAKLDADLAEHPITHSELSLTGIGALWLKLMDYIMSSQIQGFSIAFSVITLMMVGIFRSFKIGLISMIPNLAPVMLALGAMGWLGIPLDYNKVTIAAVALGISVDDTIHLMTRFHHEFSIHRNYEKALRIALGDVGRALVITSIALVFGFLVLMASELRAQAIYGLLLSGAIVTALIADLFFMPALVFWLKPFGPEGVGHGTTLAEEAEIQEAA